MEICGKKLLLQEDCVAIQSGIPQESFEIDDAKFSICEACKRGVIAELIYRAGTDPLTELANRFKAQDFHHNFTAEKERGLIDGVGIIFLDIKNFKLANEEKGHGFGDEILKKMKKFTNGRPTDLVARWGGDEVLVIMPLKKPDGDLIKISMEDQLKVKSDHILHEFRSDEDIANFNQNSNPETMLGLHIGFALHQDDDSLKQHAKKADPKGDFWLQYISQQQQ